MSRQTPPTSSPPKSSAAGGNHRGESAAKQIARLTSRRFGFGRLAPKEFLKAAFPVLEKNAAKTRESKQAFVGQPRSVCLGAARENAYCYNCLLRFTQLRSVQLCPFMLRQQGIGGISLQWGADEIALYFEAPFPPNNV